MNEVRIHQDDSNRRLTAVEFQQLNAMPAAINVLEHEAGIAKVQAWLGHANISTTKIYDRRQMRPEDSPTYKVKY